VPEVVVVQNQQFIPTQGHGTWGYFQPKWGCPECSDCQPPQEFRDVSALEDSGEDPEAEVTANVGAATSLAQTTPHTSRKSDVAVDIGIGREDLVPGFSAEILPTPSYLQSLQTSTLSPPGHSKVVFFLSDPSLVKLTSC